MKDITIPSSVCEAICSIEDCDAGEIFKAVYLYYNGSNYKFQSLVAEAMFNVIKPQINDLISKEKKKHEAHVRAGKKSAEARRQKSTRRINTSAKNEVNTTLTLEQRKLNFKKRVIACQSEKYDIKLLQDFFTYWSEHGENDRKMRFEKEKTFGINARLHTFYRFRERFNGNQKKKSDRL